MGMGLADISERSYDPEEIEASVTDKQQTLDLMTATELEQRQATASI
jgi:hypothetical protein